MDQTIESDVGALSLNSSDSSVADSGEDSEDSYEGSDLEEAVDLAGFSSIPSSTASSVNRPASSTLFVPESPEISLGMPLNGDTRNEAVFGHGASRRKAYKIVGRLGSGSQASIRLVQSMENGGALFAMKVIVKPNNPEAKMRAETHFRRRSQILWKLIGTSPYVPVYKEGFETRSKIYLVLEVLESDLEQYLKEHGPISEAAAAIVTVKLLSILVGMHSGGCIHRDVKHSNLLLRKADDPTSIVVNDFSSSFLPPAKDAATATGDSNLSVGSENQLSHTIAGTPYFLAPEIGEICPLFTLFHHLGSTDKVRSLRNPLFYQS